MNKLIFYLLASVCVVMGTSVLQLQAQVPTSSLRENIHRIVFLGNSITYAGGYISDMETWWRIHYPSQRLEWINVGLPSETVSGLSELGHADGKFPRPDLHERLKRVLTQTKPDLVIACYGMNDGIYLPLDAKRFKQFREGIFWLHQQVEAAGAAIIHVTPPVFDEVRGGHPGYAAVLNTYSSWLLGLTDSLHWQVADIHFPMKAELDNRRLRDSTFCFAADGVHPDSTGHLLMAKQLLMYLGDRNALAIQSTGDLYGHTREGRRIHALISQRQALMKDAWLTATHHTRPGMTPGLPMQEARKRYLKLDKQIGSNR